MSAKLQIYNTFFPFFGSGAPDISVPTDRPYYDTDTDPYTPYIYEGGAWCIYGLSTVSVDATSLQDIPVSATAPNDGQILKYNGSEYAPS